MTEPAWRIRAAEPSDAEACAAIAVRAWERVHEAFAAIIGQALHDFLWSHWRDHKAEDVLRHVRERPHDAAVAVDDADGSTARVVGFATWRCHAATGVGEIGNNAVDPDRQGTGIGSALHGHALEVFRQNGMAVARVTTGLDDGHAPARRAYEKAGFTVGLPSVTYYQVLAPQRVGGSPPGPGTQG